MTPRRNGGDASDVVWFCIPEPPQLRGGEGGEGQDPGASDIALGADLGDEFAEEPRFTAPYRTARTDIAALTSLHERGAKETARRLAAHEAL